LIENEAGIEDEYLAIIRLVIEKAAKACARGIPGNAEISVTLTGDERIRELNKTFRNIDAATDVLSFPLIKDLADVPYYGGVSFGDIVISADKAREQAREYGHSLERELGFLAVHGTLHLFGYDHEKPEDEAVMTAKQEDILNRCGLIR